jgi:hypothetical protein
MTQKITKEVEIEAATQKKDVSDLEYRQKKIAKYLSANNQDATGLDSILKLAPTGMKYALISILDAKNNANANEIYSAQEKGWVPVPLGTHPELDLNVSTTGLPWTTYKEFYLFQIEDFVLEARDAKELRDNEARAHEAKYGYKPKESMGKGILNDWDKTNLDVEYGDLKSFFKN